MTAWAWIAWAWIAAGAVVVVVGGLLAAVALMASAADAREAMRAVEAEQHGDGVSSEAMARNL